jgi:hypothetical protein
MIRATEKSSAEAIRKRGGDRIIQNRCQSDNFLIGVLLRKSR